MTAVNMSQEIIKTPHQVHHQGVVFYIEKQSLFGFQWNGRQWRAHGDWGVGFDLPNGERSRRNIYSAAFRLNGDQVELIAYSPNSLTKLIKAAIKRADCAAPKGGETKGDQT